MYIDIEVYRGDDNIFLAACPEFNLFSHAETQDEAVMKLKKNILHFLENSKAFQVANEDIEFSEKFYSSRYPQVH